MASDPNSNAGEGSLDEFLSAVSRTGVLTEAQAERLRGEVERGGLPSDPAPLAERLVLEGLLTEFQASRLLVGKGDSLAIGRYTLIDRIGAGGMGLVFKARHQLMDRVVALKVISPRSARRRAAVPRFLREMKLVGLLDHPNVVRAFDAGLHENAPYFVMEYLTGKNLLVIQQERGTLPPGEVVGYMVQAARGLAHAHEKGVIHRDVKPSNLFVDASGNLKILDLGLGGFFEGFDEEAELGAEDRRIAVGTADYVAPEQITGKPLDARVDLYSLGCTMYRLLTGAFAFPGGSKDERMLKRVRERHVPIRQVRPELPSDLVAVVDRLLAPLPQDRFASAADAADALESLVSYRPGAAPERGAKRRGQGLGAAARHAAEPDLPPLDTSVIEAALGPPNRLRPAPAPAGRRAEVETRAPVVRELDSHRRALEADGEQSGRDVYRQYYTELSQLRREARAEPAEDPDGQEASAGRRWLESLGERLGDFLSEPTAPKIVFLLLVIAVALAVALGIALS
jgi:serine/threonine-protein kinase